MIRTETPNNPNTCSYSLLRLDSKSIDRTCNFPMKINGIKQDAENVRRAGDFPSHHSLLGEIPSHHSWAKPPVLNLLPPETLLFDLKQLGHGRIAVFATVTVLFPVCTPQGGGSMDFCKACSIVDLSVLVRQMSPVCRNARICLDKGTESTEQVGSSLLFGRLRLLDQVV